MTGLMFQKANSFKMNNFAKHCFVATKSRLSNGKPLELSFKKRDFNKANNIFEELGADLVKIIEVKRLLSLLFTFIECSLWYINIFPEQSYDERLL